MSLLKIDGKVVCLPCVFFVDSRSIVCLKNCNGPYHHKTASVSTVCIQRFFLVMIICLAKSIHELWVIDKLYLFLA